MEQIGKKAFVNSKILNEKIELTEHSLTMTQHLQCYEHLLMISIKSDSNISRAYSRLYFYDSEKENWNLLVNISPQYMVTPSNMSYTQYVARFGESICSSKAPKYFKAILAVMGTDRASLLKQAEQKLSETEE